MMSNDDNDGQMIFGDLVGLKLPDICLIGAEKPQKNLTQETCPDQGLNLGPLRDRCACYHIHIYLIIWVKGDWDFQISDLVKNPDGSHI